MALRPAGLAHASATSPPTPTVANRSPVCAARPTPRHQRRATKTRTAARVDLRSHVTSGVDRSASTCSSAASSRTPAPRRSPARRRSARPSPRASDLDAGRHDGDAIAGSSATTPRRRTTRPVRSTSRPRPTWGSRSGCSPSARAAPAGSRERLVGLDRCVTAAPVPPLPTIASTTMPTSRASCGGQGHPGDQGRLLTPYPEDLDYAWYANGTLIKGGQPVQLTKKQLGKRLSCGSRPPRRPTSR